jgi:hypothetical protein
MSNKNSYWLKPLFKDLFLLLLAGYGMAQLVLYLKYNLL